MDDSLLPTRNEIFANEIFKRPQPTTTDLDDELVFEHAAELNNPLAMPLTACLRKIRALRQTLETYRAALKAAIESLHAQERELHALRRRNLSLIDELRATRRERLAA